ncbi:IS66 family insertion sequence element accessory protein TnpB [Paracoccus sp. MKU1]|uniref:IS66 family insertion sequence element accessory protein TnpB n=1 Tax=Paracoccus sp. MKU1 TaxID=1745182 RepID=UPI0009E83BF0
MVAMKPVDFGKGHDGLRAGRIDAAQRSFHRHGVFRSRRTDRLKPLYWDGTDLAFGACLEPVAAWAVA